MRYRFAVAASLAVVAVGLLASFPAYSQPCFDDIDCGCCEICVITIHPDFPIDTGVGSCQRVRGCTCGGDGSCTADWQCGADSSGEQMCCSVIGTCGQCDDFFPWSEPPGGGETVGCFENFGPATDGSVGTL